MSQLGVVGNLQPGNTHVLHSQARRRTNLPYHRQSSARPLSHNMSRRRMHTGADNSRRSTRRRTRYTRLSRYPHLGASDAQSPGLLEPDAHSSIASPNAMLTFPFQEARRGATRRTTNRTRYSAWRPHSLADSAGRPLNVAYLTEMRRVFGQLDEQGSDGNAQGQRLART